MHKPRVKIFVGYHEPHNIFKSEVYQPILTSAIDWDETDLISDDTGINIADRNKYYGELSGHYWVWKNFMPDTDVEYIGFGHYRRFLDFNITIMPDVPFKPVLAKEFRKTFKQYTEENILNCIEGYDIILPQKAYFKSILYSQYLRWHPQKDMNLALNIIRDLYPEYIETAKQVMGSKDLYICLNFIMKKELLNEYMEWIFTILLTLEKRADWSEYIEYTNIRTPAFIAERFFNIWLVHTIATKKLKVLNTSSVLLVGKNYGNCSVEVSMEKYKILVDKYEALKSGQAY